MRSYIQNLHKSLDALTKRTATTKISVTNIPCRRSQVNLSSVFYESIGFTYIVNLGGNHIDNHQQTYHQKTNQYNFNI